MFVINQISIVNQLLIKNRNVFFFLLLLLNDELTESRYFAC